MPDAAPKPDEIDEAIARAWRPRTLEELMAGVPVFESWDGAGRRVRPARVWRRGIRALSIHPSDVVHHWLPVGGW